MARGGADKDSDGPERRCVVTGETGPKAGLVRFVVGPDDTVVPDVAGRLPGRGIWVSADRAVLERAVAKRMFSKGAKRQALVPDGLVAQVEAALLRRLQDAIAMARKAGALVTANFMLSPEAQARKQDPEFWGDPTVLDVEALSDGDRALFDAIDLGDSTLPPDQLGPRLDEPHPTWMEAIERAWTARYGTG